MSVVLEDGKGWDNFPTANNSLFSLYKPTVVMYGAKNEPVVKSYDLPVIWSSITDGFWVKLNSFSLKVHLNNVSYIVYEDENEQVTLDDVTNILNMSIPVSPP